MDEVEIERLRMKLIQSSLDFLSRFSNGYSFLTFEEVEKRTMINILNAPVDVLQSLARFRNIEE